MDNDVRQNIGGKFAHLRADISELCILIVDDSATSRHTIMYLLQKEGFTNLHEAEDGEVALAMTQEIDPDLVILDIMMPKLDGFGYCQEVRHIAGYENMPILVQSGNSDKHTISKAFDCGATDYISKPISSRELAARVRVHLENRKLIKQLTKYSKRVEGDLEEAQKMQIEIIPSAAECDDIMSSYDIELAQYFKSSSELGGDFWGINHVDDGRFMVYLVDFSGHGVAASLNTFRLHTIIQEFSNEMGAVQPFLFSLNNKLCKLLSTGQYATMFCGLVDTKHNTIEYAIAGCPFPIVIKNKNASSKDMQLVGSGLPIGVAQDVVYDCYTTHYQKGDGLLLYSDALIESPDKNGKHWSELSVFKKMLKCSKKSASDMMDDLVDSFQKDVPEVTDDLTMVLLKL